MSTKIFTSVFADKVVDTPPDLLKQAVQYAILENKPLAENITAANLASISHKADRFLNFGKTGGYIYGLPEGDMLDDNLNESAIIDAIEAENVGEALTVDFTFFNSTNVDYLVYEYLQNNYGWDVFYNQLTVAPYIGTYKGYVQTGTHIVVEYEDEDDSQAFLPFFNISDDIEGIHALYHYNITPLSFSTISPDFILPNLNTPIVGNPTTFQFDPNGETIENWLLEIGTFAGNDLYYNSGIIAGTTISLIVNGLPDNYEKLYATLKYKIAGTWFEKEHVFNENVPITKFWFKGTSDPIFPSLREDTSIALNSDFYPIVPIRLNKVNSNTDTNSDLYKHTKKALNYFSLNLNSVINSIEENPDIGVIDDVFVLLAVDVYRDSPEELKYLYHFFNFLEQFSTLNKTNYISNLNSSVIHESTTNTVVVKETDFVTSIKYNYIEKLTISNNGIAGTFTKSIVIKDPIEKTYTIKESDGSNVEYTNNWEQSEIILYYQDTATTMQILIVSGFHTENEIRISGTYGESNYYATYNNKYLTNISDPDDLDYDALFIPLSHTIYTEHFTSKKEKELLIYSTLHVVVYAIQVIKLKWYQSSIFLNLLKIIAIVLTVYTGIDFIQGAFALSATAGYIAIIKVIAITALVDYSVEWLLKNVDGVLGDILALLVILVSQGFSSKSSFSNLLPLADQLVDLVNIFIKFEEINSKLEMENLQYEVDKFTEEYEIRQKELDDIKELLSDSNPLTNPLYMLDSLKERQTAYDSPSTFYNNHIHENNVGVKSLDVIPFYVDALVQLPKMDKIQLTTGK